jgi:hypothetical protein
LSSLPVRQPNFIALSMQSFVVIAKHTWWVILPIMIIFFKYKIDALVKSQKNCPCERREVISAIAGA